MASLTAKRKTLIKSSWSNLKGDLTSNGVEFLVKLFTDFPEYMTFFKAFNGTSPGEIRSQPKAKMHGRVLMETIDKVVANLDDLDAVVASLHKIVKTHFPRGVTGSQFQATLECFGRFLADQLGAGFDADTQEAWGAAVQLLASVMDTEYQRLKQIDG